MVVTCVGNVLLFKSNRTWYFIFYNNDNFSAATFSKYESVITNFIFLTNIEKLTYFLIHFLDIFKFLKYFFENFSISKNSTYFFEISRIFLKFHVFINA